ncbi:hypothetical protein COW36_02920 [bacterium (Candidatus Blackallbacteria) CG17_big_fil_post_rev_8_21_14_2_50_48_46]|uniref:Haloacid dehalogenase-like hydrolase n=1 Tax=bacterium (Candidatus Blackallbacteria) CG17_big_fil_post_rev_8_21_14_2_50_48_46 TaxID=2014261 RepID=A0A2M7GAB3_9BACT|nr:MAG: hypothetical protein COW64_12555 [bacterium (Candidatus Blackallbacteria) CG18_big_fil_WC_8_21_14_2_50_49_26]PIW19080.1 MAG: hypothetical protein COW36_02920 [bacterium (Candidatus Blackallbacteria) CG17_big_fil_post_rev_8_21_14_2_50_48_46]PIW44553.1 MAG: hypothetical protein COW20_23200 [bacterium (Candidatus Blackallbacteria) CG13_big_fil_rev_8_21_14_2_50_49_14]
MKIGVDFDNTIVCYDALFHTLACEEQKLIPLETPVSKGAVRDALRAVGHEESWIAMQGEVYGARITEATPFEGVKDFFRAAQALGIKLSIVSHKTLHPFRGPQYDLHEAARSWLRFHGFWALEASLLPETSVFLELTKEAKFARIAALNCDYFIDDLPEFLQDPGFPATTVPILFDPANLYGDSSLQRLCSWRDLQAWLNTLDSDSNEGVPHGLS